MNSLDEKYYYTDLEFFVLLAAIGKTEWRGFNSLCDPGLLDDEKAIHSVMASLYQKGEVEWGDDGMAVLSGKARRVFPLLKNAKSYIYARRSGADESCRIFYLCRDYIVSVERSINEEATLKAAAAPAEDLYGFLLDNYFEEDIDGSQTDDVLPEYVDFSKDIDEQMMENSRYLSVMEVADYLSDSLISRLMVTDCGQYYLLEYQNDCERKVWKNTNENRIKALKIMLAEEDLWY